MNVRLLFVSTVLCAATALAQPPPEQRPPSRRAERSRAMEEESGTRRERIREEVPSFPPRDAHPALERYMDMLSERNPEEAERLRTLRKEDPEAFRQALRGKVMEARERMRPGEGLRRPPLPFAEDIRAVNTAKDPEAKEAAVAALREKVSAWVDQRLEMRERRMEAVRQELEKLEEQHRKDVERRAELIEQSLQRLMKGEPAETEPDPPPPPPPPPLPE